MNMNMNERKPANAAEEIIQLYSKYTLEKIFKSYNTIDHILNDWNNCNSDDHYIFMNWLKSNFAADQDVTWFYKKSAKVIGANTIDIFVFMKEIRVKLKNGKSVLGDKFDENDLSDLKNIFRVWMNLNKCTKHLGGRNINVPDILSEGLYCYFFNAVRTNGTAGSYDAVDINTGEGIQIKSASIKNDCTSFGPTSTWDRLYFLDFAPNGNVDGNVFFYEIISDNINKLIEYNLIEEVGRLDAIGRPLLFGTTEEFLRSFGVTSMEDLPVINPVKVENLRQEAEEEVQLSLNLHNDNAEVKS